MQTSFYPEQIMCHLLTPLNTGRMTVDNITIFMAEIGDFSKAIKIELYFKIDNGIIRQVKYLVYGNGYIIAALSYLSAKLLGMHIKAVMSYSMSNLVNELEIPVNVLPALKLIKHGMDDIINQYLAIYPKIR
jgi:NifU-like protein involved in Fe-S cluster formation